MNLQLNKAQLEQIITDTAVRAAQETVSRFVVAHPRPQFVSAKQAAEMIGVSRSTISTFIKTGRLKYNKAGLISIGDVDELLK